MPGATEKIRTAYERHRTWIGIFLVLVIVLTSLALRLKHLPSYPYSHDEARSILTARNMAHYGYPAFENGEIYTRALLHHCGLGLIIHYCGIDMYAVRSINLALGALTIVLAYVMAKELGGEVAGVLAAFLIAFSTFEHLQIISARFYGSFQFLFTLTIYCFYHGWIRNKNKFKVATMLSLAATILTHELGVGLIAVLFIYLLVTGRWRSLRDPFLWAMVVIAAPCIYYTLFYHPIADPFGQIEFNHAIKPLRMGAVLRSSDKFVFLRALETAAFPGLWLIVLGLLFPHPGEKRQFRYYCFALFSGLAIVTLVAPKPAPKYISNLFPLYIIVLCYCLWYGARLLLRAIRENWDPGGTGQSGQSTKRNAAAYTIVGLSVLLFIFTQSGRGLGFKPTATNPRKVNRFLSRHMKQDDILVSTNPGVTSLYLRKPDYFLRQQWWDESNEKVKHRAFDFEVNERRNIRMLDTKAELKDLRDSEKVVWIYGDSKIQHTIGEPLKLFLYRNFFLVYNHKDILVFSNRDIKDN